MIRQAKKQAVKVIFEVSTGKKISYIKVNLYNDRVATRGYRKLEIDFHPTSYDVSTEGQEYLRMLDYIPRIHAVSVYAPKGEELGCILNLCLDLESEDILTPNPTAKEYETRNRN